MSRPPFSSAAAAPEGAEGAEGAGEGTAAERWAAQLAGWKIPQEIEAQATEPPWGFPAAVFKASARPQEPDSPPCAAAREALPTGGSVLDVGCGGGAGALSLVPPAAELTGVDSSAELLALFAADAAAAGVTHREVHGSWPQVAPAVPAADVVTCHHVVYNVADIEPFLLALGEHARRRVVVELTARHPLCATSSLWQRFWGVDRPDGPTADDLLAVLADLGVEPTVVRGNRPARRERTDPAQVAMVRRQLCLAPEREREVAAALAELPDDGVDVVALWWDASRTG